MTNVSKPEFVDGIASRAAKVVEKCKASVGQSLDAYVSDSLFEGDLPN